MKMPNKGDVIYSIHSKFFFPYEHYAIYIGDGKVIHYAPDSRHGGEPTIHEASFDEFLEEADTYHVRHLPSTKKALEILLKAKNIDAGIIADFLTFYDESGYHYFSPEETVKRAEGVLNENGIAKKGDYSVVFDNCEHFAIWCKCNLRQSTQIDRFIKDILG